MRPRWRDRILGIVLLLVAVIFLGFALLHAALAASSSRQGHSWVLDLVLALVLLALGLLCIHQRIRLRNRR